MPVDQPPHAPARWGRTTPVERWRAASGIPTTAARGAAPPRADAPPERTPANGPRARIEAALWVAEGPLTAARLAKLAGLDTADDARRLVAELRQAYQRRGAALDIMATGAGYRVMTRPEYAPWLARGSAALGGRELESASRLSGPALEVLAVVADRQPALRAEVEAIRGVGCGELLRQLLEADLLRIVGRSEELGRPLLYGTTKRFLEVFGLRSLEELPRASERATTALPTTQNAPATPGSAA